MNPALHSKPNKAYNNIFVRRSRKYWLVYNRIKVLAILLTLTGMLSIVINVLISSSNFLPITNQNILIVNRIAIVVVLATLIYINLFSALVLVIDWALFLKDLKLLRLFYYFATSFFASVIIVLVWLLFIETILSKYIFVSAIALIFMLQLIVCLLRCRQKT